MGNFADKYTGYKRKRGKPVSDDDDEAVLHLCTCGAPVEYYGCCAPCYEQQRQLQPVEKAILERRVNVPSRNPGERAHDYFLRAYVASTLRRDE